MKRSLEITLKVCDRGMINTAVNAFEDAGIEVVAGQSNFIQVRQTTPTEIRRVLVGKGVKIFSIKDGFRR